HRKDLAERLSDLHIQSNNMSFERDHAYVLGHYKGEGSTSTQHIRKESNCNLGENSQLRIGRKRPSTSHDASEDDIYRVEEPQEAP
ncbi:hypothetical protein MKX01_032736, partial [Papaver californicum]